MYIGGCGFGAWVRALAALTVTGMVCALTPAVAQAAPSTSSGSLWAGPVRAGAGAVVHPSFALRTRVAAVKPAEPGDHLQVSVGDKTYPAPTAGSWACSTGVWVLQLERKSLEETHDGSTVYPLCSAGDATKLKDALVKIGDEQITVVNTLNRGPGGDSRTLPGLGDALSKIGVPAQQFASIDLAKTSFSVFGIPGLSSGQAHTATQPLVDEANEAAGSATAASINGTLIPDNHGNFTLTMQDYVTYDIAAGGAIVLDGHAYPVPGRPSGFSGGFHLLVVDRRTLAPVSDTLYATNNDQGEQYRMGSDLARLRAADNQSVLVFLATVGDPVGGSALSPGPIDLPKPCVGSAAFTVTCTYRPTGDEQDGSEQQFTVPRQMGGYPVSQLQIRLQGAYGNQADDGGQGGDPNRVTTTQLPIGADAQVKPGQTLYVEVGGTGAGGGRRDGGRGGWNGGGNGGSSGPYASYGWPGGGGGGASDVRTMSRATGNSTASLDSRLIVAAGGGGAGGDSHDAGAGGDGGDAGSSGSNGVPGNRSTGYGGGGHPGTATQGGTAGDGALTGYTAGTLGVGGAGTYTDDNFGASGGGGGGYFGGGGGGTGRHRGGGGAGGGGGGSDLVPAGGTVAPVITHEPAEVSVSYSVPYGTLGAALRPFGATPSVINGLGTSPRYALVGMLAPPQDIANGLSLDSPEASPQIAKGSTGQLQGVLERGQQNMWYSSLTSNAPVMEDGNQPSVTNYGLYKVIAQAPKHWPLPAPGPEYDAQQKALTYLSQQTCGDECTNIRDQYNANQNTILTWQKAMDPKGGVAYKSGLGFDKRAFGAVKAQLNTELGDVFVVDGLKAGMRTLLSDQQQMLQPTLKSVYAQVRESIPEVADNTKLGVSIASFILELFTIAAEITGQHEIGAALGVVNAVLKFSTELADEPNGDGKDLLSTTVDKLGEKTALTFAAALTSLSQTFNYVYDDWGKLSVVADGLLHHEPEWDVSAADAGQYVTVATNAIRLSYYRALVPLVYNHRYEAQGAPTDDLQKWCVDSSVTFSKRVCQAYASGKYYKFAYPSSAYGFKVAAPALNFKPAHDIILVSSLDRVPSPLPTELMKQMTESGLYAPYLFLRWRLEHNITCQVGISINRATKCVDDDGPVFGAHPPTITTSQLPAATVGRPYRAVLNATGGGAPDWSLAPGEQLPAGLALSRGGMLSGTPTRAGQYRFTVTVGSRLKASLDLTVRAAGPGASAPRPTSSQGPAPARTTAASSSQRQSPTSKAAASSQGQAPANTTAAVSSQSPAPVRTTAAASPQSQSPTSKAAAPSQGRALANSTHAASSQSRGPAYKLPLLILAGLLLLAGAVLAAARWRRRV